EPDEAGQPDGAAVSGDDAEPHLGQAEARVLRRDTEMARQRQLAAAAQGEASDRGQNRLRKALDGAEYVLSVPAHAHTRDGIHPGELADVRAGDERLLARAGEDDAAHLGVVAEPGE